MKTLIASPIALFAAAGGLRFRSLRFDRLRTSEAPIKKETGAMFAVLGSAVPPADAFLEKLIVSPKKIVDAAIEARSSQDLAKDNEIVAKFNVILANLGSFNASSTIYEQTLLITGLFDDKEAYDRLKAETGKIEGVKKLHWKAAYMSADDQKRRDNLLSWDDVLLMGTKAEARLIGDEGVADVNFRTTADAFGTLYLMGRARSKEELDLAILKARDGNGVKKLVSYAFARP
jgi:osmotically-inducible protein OsmY